MFKRKLKALGYLEWNKVDENNPEHFRKVVVWLEDQKIRYYPINKRDNLQDIKSDNWPTFFNRYCKDVKCPKTSNTLEQLEWLIGYAIRLAYKDISHKFSKLTGKNDTNRQYKVTSCIMVDSLDNLNFSSSEFKNMVNAIAKLLKVPQHPDHLITLNACCNVISDRLGYFGKMANCNNTNVEGTPFPIQNTQPGINLGDPVLDNAAKCLTLLYVKQLRDIQTRINETIVEAQNLTSNPKTDTKLGKVGK